MLTAIEEVEKILKENNLQANVYENELSIICVEINHGDWKHEHLKCKLIMSENGFEQIGENIIDENDSDCYSSIHYFLEEGI